MTEPKVHEVLMNGVPIRYVHKTLSTRREKIYETDTQLYLLEFRCDPPARVDAALRNEEHFPGMDVSVFKTQIGIPKLKFEEPKSIPKEKSVYYDCSQCELKDGVEFKKAEDNVED